jgi:tetratricopeptide (TPR) repeat protein
VAYPQVVSGVTSIVQAADSAFAAGDRKAAAKGYRAVLAADSTHSSRAAYRLAVLLAEEGAFDEAISLHRLYARLEPRDLEGAVGFARTYAWAGRTDDALAQYRAVLAAERDYRAAALGAGEVLAWAGHFAESVAEYRAWLATHPEDREASLGMARTLAWWGKLGEAERLYDSLGTQFGDAEARKGLALVAAWQGNLVRSERLWRDLAQDEPNDAEIWTGLAQVLRWRGLPFDARDALNRALTIDPGHREARVQRRWLDSELAPTLYARALQMGDSDDNVARIYVVEAAMMPSSQLRLRVEGAQVHAEFAGTRRRSQTARAKSVARLPWRDGEWSARAELGANWREARPARVVGSLGLGGRLTRATSLDARFVRAVIDENVALIDAGITSTGIEADWEAQVVDRLSVFAAGGHARVTSDATSNTRMTAAFGARWALAQNRSIGISARSLQHANEVRAGYFSPRRYEHLELSARARTRGDLGWALSGDAGVGLQSVDYFGTTNTQPTQRFSGTVSYVSSPGSEWSLSAALANVATTGTSSAGGYRFGSLGFAARFPLR